MKTVIIHGRKWSDEQPLAGRQCELWGNGRNGWDHWKGQLGGWSRYFDVHPVQATAYHPGIVADRPGAWRWYRSLPADRPIYLTNAHPDVPASVAYPLDYVLTALDDVPAWRLSTSIDEMIALALAEEFDRIILNGVGVGVEDNAAWQVQHQGIHFWIGYAIGKGVEVLVEGPSLYGPARDAGVYGFDHSRYGSRPRRRTVMESRR
jgi:hypothetical protein